MRTGAQPVLLAFVATPSSGNPATFSFDALPRPGERPAQPIWLPAHAEYFATSS